MKKQAEEKWGMCSSLRFSDNKATEAFSISPACLIPPLSAPVCVDSEQVFLIINPGDFSVLFGIKEWAAASSLPGKSCSMLCPYGIPPESGQGHPEHKDPLVPKRAFICSPLPFLLQSCLLLLWVLQTILGTCSSHQDCLCLFQLVYFCFIYACQEDAKKLLNSRHLVSWGCLGKAFLRDTGSMTQAGTSRHFTLLWSMESLGMAKESNPSSSCRGATHPWLPLPSLSLLQCTLSLTWRVKGWCSATSFLVHKHTPSGGRHLAVLCWSHRSKMMVSVQLLKHHTRDESALSCLLIYGSESLCTAILLSLQCGPLWGSFRQPPGLFHPHTSVSQACFAMDKLRDRLETTTVFCLTENSSLVTTELELSFSSLSQVPTTSCMSSKAALEICKPAPVWHGLHL